MLSLVLARGVNAGVVRGVNELGFAGGRLPPPVLVFHLLKGPFFWSLAGSPVFFPSRFWYSASSALYCHQFRSTVIARSYHAVSVSGGFSDSINFRRIGVFRDRLNSSTNATSL